MPDSKGTARTETWPAATWQPGRTELVQTLDAADTWLEVELAPTDWPSGRVVHFALVESFDNGASWKEAIGGDYIRAQPGPEGNPRLGISLPEQRPPGYLVKRTIDVVGGAITCAVNASRT